MNAFRDALVTLPARSLRGRFYRAVEDGRGNVLDTRGTLEAGGRYNPPGEFGALYCSDDDSVSLEEKKAQGEGPVVRLVPLDVALARVLDLTDEAALRTLRLAKDQLTGDDHSLTRELGRSARACGLEGLLVPSSLARGRNLVVFLDCLVSGSDVSPVEDESRRQAV